MILQKQFESLEKKLEGTRAGRLLNRVHGPMDLYWNLYYTSSFAALAGIGNAIGHAGNGIQEMGSEFTNGALNNAKLGILINLFYSKAINLINKTEHPFLYSNLFCAAVQAGFYSWHGLMGTQNPELTMLLPVIASFALTNYHASQIKPKIEASGAAG